MQRSVLVEVSVIVVRLAMLKLVMGIRIRLIHLKRLQKKSNILVTI